MNAQQTPVYRQYPASTPQARRPPAPRRRVRPVPQAAPKPAARSVPGSSAAETTLKIGVNLLLAIASAAALSRLIPHLQDQQAQLTQLKTAVTAAEADTAKLQDDFGRYFDPSQASAVMQEQSGRESPLQRQIVWIDPSHNTP